LVALVTPGDAVKDQPFHARHDRLGGQPWVRRSQIREHRDDQGLEGGAALVGCVANRAVVHGFREEHQARRGELARGTRRQLEHAVDRVDHVVDGSGEGRAGGPGQLDLDDPVHHPGHQRRASPEEVGRRPLGQASAVVDATVGE
jgi:hypothetical protein